MFVFQDKVGEGFYDVLISYKQYFFDLHFKAQKKFLKDTEVSKVLRDYLGQFQKSVNGTLTFKNIRLDTSGPKPLSIDATVLEHKKGLGEGDLWFNFLIDNDLSFEKFRLFKSTVFVLLGRYFEFGAQQLLVFCKNFFFLQKRGVSLWFFGKWWIFVKGFVVYLKDSLIWDTLPLLKNFWVFLKNHLKTKNFDNIAHFWADHFRPAFFLIFEWVSRRFHIFSFLKLAKSWPNRLVRGFLRVALFVFHLGLLLFVWLKLLLGFVFKKMFLLLTDLGFVVLYFLRLGPFTDFLYIVWYFIFLETTKALVYCVFWLYYLAFFGYVLGTIDLIFGSFFQRLPKKLWNDNSILFYLFSERLHLRLFPHNFVHTLLFRKVFLDL